MKFWSIAWWKNVGSIYCTPQILRIQQKERDHTPKDWHMAYSRRRPSQQLVLFIEFLYIVFL